MDGFNTCIQCALHTRQVILKTPGQSRVRHRIELVLAPLRNVEYVSRQRLVFGGPTRVGTAEIGYELEAVMHGD